MRRHIAMLALGALLLAAHNQDTGGESGMSFRLTSPAFPHNGEIPRRFTCEGEDVSPPLAWSGTPEGTKSFALIVDDPDAPDPDAPQMTWVHWVLYNLLSSARELPEARRFLRAPKTVKMIGRIWASRRRTRTFTPTLRTNRVDCHATCEPRPKSPSRAEGDTCDS